ncbi:MAG: DUF2946 family protein [Sheuella sp.]|nr:DUF2946 family protein [Sheuella sp.]
MRINKTKSFWLWFTALAMLMAALMPSLSHSARAQTGTDALSPVCTSTGMKWFNPVSGEILEQTAQTESGSANEHCDWCSVHPVTLFSPLSAPTPLFLELAETVLPVYRAVTGPFCWPSSHPRAPPRVA